MEPESVMLPHHLEQLTQGSGIAAEVIAERGYRSVWPPEGYSVLKPYRFTRQQANLPGLLLPLWTTDGQNGLFVYKPDHPRQNRKGDDIKYELPKGAGVRLDCPPRCQPMLADPRIPLWVTEGQKKGDALATCGLCAVDLLGVWNFKGLNPFGGTTLLADFDYITLKNRSVYIVFDSDVMAKRQVKQALDRLTEHLQRKGAHVSAVYLPQAGGQKIGVDDYLLTHTVQDLQGLIEAPRPQPQPAAPIVELLDEAPKMLTRPLMLIDGHAYAATWLWTRTTITEVLRDNEVVRLAEPKITKVRRLFVVRDDGVVFGDGADHPIDELGLEVGLQDLALPDQQLWQSSGVKAYRAGRRPDPLQVFERIHAVYGHYLDFSRSLASQEQMSQLLTCCSLITWFMDAYDVGPYLWPNGDWGSGKTKCGTIWAMTSYLGQVVTWGGSFAALRDLADCGAALLFDDAENIEDPRSDPDKRALLLAGNRRGAKVPLKEPTANGKGWRIRWVNAYCPRGFTAKKLPSGALASRAIVIPLVRTADAVRGNRDPARTDHWPCDWRHLQDDLWAVALMLLPEAARLWTEMDQEAGIVGRNFEPWRALVAVARLFERHGVKDLEATIRGVMKNYLTEERPNLGGDSYVVAVVRALLRLTTPNNRCADTSGTADTSDTLLGVSSSEICEAVNAVLTAQEVDNAWVTPSRIGRIMASLRFPKTKRTDKQGSRGWQLTRAAVLSTAMAYGIQLPSDTNDDNTPSGMNVSDTPEASEVSADVPQSSDEWEEI